MGYAPILDVVLPTRGADGSAPGEDPPSPPDGVTFLSASYLGCPVGATMVAFAADGTALHPILGDGAGQPLVVNAADFGARPGDTLVVLRLPFGSFAPDQPAAAIALSLSLSPLADPDTPLTIASRGAFAFGLDPLNNPRADPPVVGGIVSDSFTPTVLAFRKSFDGPEGETATGPNSPRTYRIAIDLADGQTLTDLRIVDRLPDGIVLAAGAGSVSVAGLPGATVDFDPATNNLTVTAPGPLVGAAGTDATITVRFFVGETLAPGDPATPVLGPGADPPRTIRNDLFAEAEWTPLDPRDPPQTITFDPRAAENSFVARPLAVQKSVVLAVDRGAPGTGPGDTLEWRISGQVSDYVSLAGLTLADRLADGQAFDPSFAPRLVVNHAGTSTVIPLDPADDVAMRNPADGTTDLSFRVGDRLGVLLGGETAGAATTFTLAYRSTIEARFASPAAPGDAVVGQGDSLSNRISAAATSTDPSGVPVGGTVTDDSAAALRIATGRVGKEIWRINGVAPTGPNPTIVSGDLVTFRLTYTLPQSSFSSLVLADFLPLPVFDIGSVSFTFDDTVSADAQAENVITWGPDAGVFAALVGARDPVFAVESGSNVLHVRFDEPLRSDPSVASTVDLLFTLRVADRPFGDGLFLTNLVQGTETNAAGRATSSQDLVGVRLSEPSLRISKGIVAFEGRPDRVAIDFGPRIVNLFDNVVDERDQVVLRVVAVASNDPGTGAGDTLRNVAEASFLAPAAPATINAAASVEIVEPNLAISKTGSPATIEAGQPISYTITVRNTGGSFLAPAFDLRLTDLFEKSALFLRPGTVSVTGVAGAEVLEGKGAGDARLIVGVPVLPVGAALTIRLIGEADVSALSGDRLDNTVRGGWSSLPGTDPGERAFAGEANASLLVKRPGIVKTVVTTDLAETSGTSVAIGETITYRITLTLAEATTKVLLRDFLPVAGTGSVAYVAGSFRVASVGANLVPADGQDLSDPTVTVTNRNDADGLGLPDTLTRDFGRVINVPDGMVDDKDRIVVELQGRVANAANTQPGRALPNRAEIDFGFGRLSSTATVIPVSPVLGLDKTADAVTGDAGDVLTFRIDVPHLAGANRGPAYDVVVTDPLNPFYELITGSVRRVSGPAGTTIESGNAAGDGVVRIEAPSYAVNDPRLVFEYQARVRTTVEPTQVLVNAARVTYDSFLGPAGPTWDRPGTPAADEHRFTVIGPALSKRVVATDIPETQFEQFNPLIRDVAIGETITSLVGVTLPEGTTTNARLTDVLPTPFTLGLRSEGVVEYLESRVVGVGANLSGPSLPPIGTILAPTDVDGDGLVDLIELPVGTVVSAPDGVVSDADRLFLEVRARVIDLPINQAGLAIVNRANLLYETQGEQRSATVTETVEIVAPRLAIATSVSPGTADAGDRLLYEIVIDHVFGASRPMDTSTEAAFDVVVEDLLPDDVGLVWRRSPTTSRHG